MPSPAEGNLWKLIRAFGHSRGWLLPSAAQIHDITSASKTRNISPSCQTTDLSTRPKVNITNGFTPSSTIPSFSQADPALTCQWYSFCQICLPSQCRRTRRQRNYLFLMSLRLCCLASSQGVHCWGTCTASVGIVGWGSAEERLANDKRHKSFVWKHGCIRGSVRSLCPSLTFHLEGFLLQEDNCQSNCGQWVPSPGEKTKMEEITWYYTVQRFEVNRVFPF